MFFEAVYRLCAPFISTPVVNMHFKIVEDLGLHAEVGAEVHLVREVFVSAGRILGLLLVWIAPQTNEGAVFVILCMIGAGLVNAWIVWIIGKSDNKARLAKENSELESSNVE